jgi:hypothetical protein
VHQPDVRPLIALEILEADHFSFWITASPGGCDGLNGRRCHWRRAGLGIDPVRRRRHYEQRQREGRRSGEMHWKFYQWRPLPLWIKSGILSISLEL